MNKARIIGLGIALVTITVFINNYLHDYNTMAKITAVKPYMLTKRTTYNECSDERHTTYSKPGDKAGVIGGVAGGATGALVTYAVTSNPVVLAGGAIAGVFGGQAIERHINKPKAHTRTIEKCQTKYKEEPIQDGYLVSFTYKGNPDERVLASKPLTDKIDISLLQAAPTAADAKTKFEAAVNTSSDSN